MAVTSSFRLHSRLESLEVELMARGKRNVTKATMHIRNALIDKVNNAGDGREYPVRPESGRIEVVEIVNKLGRKQRVRKIVGAKIHKASRPGEPPAVLRGQLKTSFQYEWEETDTLFRGYTGPVNVPYAKALEFGFVGKDKNGRYHNLAPRPYMAPTWHEEKVKVKQILKRGFE